MTLPSFNKLKIPLSPLSERSLKVLVLSRSYPNNVMELLGLWVERLVRHSTSFCAPIVISPVPYCPPIRGLADSFVRFRRIEHRSLRGGVEAFHPRFLVGPGYSLYSVEWMLYYAAIRRLADRIQRNAGFDLIHAHFSYPDGVAAVLLGRRYQVPVIITEHIPWDVWATHPQVRRRAIRAIEQCDLHISVSNSVHRSVQHYLGPDQKMVVVPNGVDGSIFTPGPHARRRIANQILFAGAVRPIKGIDILLRSMRLLKDRYRHVTLLVIGEPFYESYRKEESRLRQIARELLIDDRVRFLGGKTPEEVAAYMEESAMLVLPSRAESFGSVLVEALACGTPVVATRCGGPEDIVNDRVGVLAPPENPEALANGIEHVLDHAADYDPAALRAHALENFGLESVGRRLEQIYDRVVREFQAPGKAKIAELRRGSIAG